ncbi:hypothetical protein HELRODRAFT_62476 [Helobdella robusta]|uniref:WW domain-containing protein n=1 Tax=Helobdella robusta TaxID=6412 RepID=T1FX14_HELRO|nr:hypothetical protein HELRODRAFT_62476 [Helobdella robusta]ESO12797.1 hypothetical protein HELRODRAFT_62476 [Helobdella robusta]
MSSVINPAINSSNIRVIDLQDPPPPPPSPPPVQRRLPPNWKSTKDSTGKIYYYHAITRQTQWDPPTWESTSLSFSDLSTSSVAGDDSMDQGTPGLMDDIDTQQHTTTTAPADTSSSEEVAKKIKDQFRTKIARHIVNYLNFYKRADCEQGRITNTEDFKYLARKLTHAVLNKELKQCRHMEDLEVNDNVKFKAKEYVNKYMRRFGPVYHQSIGTP